MRNLFEELDKICKLPVSHQKSAIKAWYETYYDERAVEWFKNHQKNKTIEYDFKIEEKVCIIRMYQHMWGWTDFIEEHGRTTSEACKKAITKFYKTYRKCNQPPKTQQSPK